MSNFLLKKRLTFEDKLNEKPQNSNNNKLKHIDMVMIFNKTKKMKNKR